MSKITPGFWHVVVEADNRRVVNNEGSYVCETFSNDQRPFAGVCLDCGAGEPTDPAAFDNIALGVNEDPVTVENVATKIVEVLSTPFTTLELDPMGYATEEAYVAACEALKGLKARAAAEIAVGLTLAQADYRAENAGKTCHGGGKWPLVAVTGFRCPDCGRIYARHELQGRDDHLPAHQVIYWDKAAQQAQVDHVLEHTNHV